MAKLKTTRFDATDYLKSDRECVLFLESAFEGGDTAHVARALRVVARARDVMKLAKETGLTRGCSLVLRASLVTIALHEEHENAVRRRGRRSRCYGRTRLRTDMRDFAYPEGMTHTMLTKPVIWMGSSQDDLGDFPADARREAGHQLWKVQCGDDPDDWKPFRQVGPGVREIRIREGSGAFRVMYLAERAEGVYVLHCFQKKTEQTSRHDVELARKRFKSLPSNRRPDR